MAGEQIAPPPFQTPMVEQGGKISKWWADWILLTLLERVQAQSPVSTSVNLTAQNASIATTSLVASANAGVYRVSYYLRVTTAAGVSSSIQVIFTSTDGTVTITQSNAAATGNTTATVQSGSFILRADAASPISYETIYGSVPAAAMEYSLDIYLEAL